MQSGSCLGRLTGDIVIYTNASGSGTLIKTPLAREYFDGYDDQGNLFFDGFTSGSAFQLDELPKGSSTPRIITTSNTVQFPGSVQWDGTYLTVFDQLANKMYQYKIKGTKAILKGTVSFSGSSDCAQTWIAKGVVYCGDAGNDNGSVFKLPGRRFTACGLYGEFRRTARHGGSTEIICVSALRRGVDKRRAPVYSNMPVL